MVFAARIPSSAELTAHYARYRRDRYVSPFTLDKYRQLLAGFEPYRLQNRILDVGCGSGFFLDIAREWGWSSYGTEYGDEAVAFCRSKGLEAREGSLESVHFPAGHFDVVTSFEVIEHLSFTRSHLEEIHRVLRPGGLLYLTTPNFNAISRRWMKEKWSVVAYPEHLTYFTPRTLRLAGRRAGFEVVIVYSDGVNVDRLINWYKKRKAIDENELPEVNQKVSRINNESIRRAAAGNPIISLARRGVDAGLRWMGAGDFLKAYFIKPER